MTPNGTANTSPTYQYHGEMAWTANHGINHGANHGTNHGTNQHMAFILQQQHQQQHQQHQQQQQQQQMQHQQHQQHHETADCHHNLFDDPHQHLQQDAPRLAML